jgi:hypothetical protein
MVYIKVEIHLHSWIWFAIEIRNGDIELRFCIIHALEYVATRSSSMFQTKL